LVAGGAGALGGVRPDGGVGSPRWFPDLTLILF